jgi:hypothetical protein
VKRGLRLAFAACALLASAAALTAERPCTKADAAAAAKAIDHIDNWSQLRKAGQDYGRCDSGALADAYTDALMRLLVDWKDVPALVQQVQQDRAFHDFIFAHLASEAAKPDLESVYSRAKASCPPGVSAFCAELAAAASPKKAAAKPKG